MLTSFQQGVLRSIAATRTPASHIAGGAALNRNLPRLTGNIEIFYNMAEAARTSADADAGVGARGRARGGDDAGLHIGTGGGPGNAGTAWAVASLPFADP